MLGRVHACVRSHTHGSTLSPDGRTRPKATGPFAMSLPSRAPTDADAAAALRLAALMRRRPAPSRPTRRLRVSKSFAIRCSLLLTTHYSILGPCSAPFHPRPQARSSARRPCLPSRDYSSTSPKPAAARTAAARCTAAAVSALQACRSTPTGRPSSARTHARAHRMRAHTACARTPHPRARLMRSRTSSVRTPHAPVRMHARARSQAFVRARALISKCGAAKSATSNPTQIVRRCGRRESCADVANRSMPGRTQCPQLAGTRRRVGSCTPTGTGRPRPSRGSQRRTSQPALHRICPRRDARTRQAWRRTQTSVQHSEDDGHA